METDLFFNLLQPILYISMYASRYIKLNITKRDFQKITSFGLFFSSLPYLSRVSDENWLVWESNSLIKKMLKIILYI